MDTGTIALESSSQANRTKKVIHIPGELIKNLRSQFNEEYLENKHLYTKPDYDRIMDDGNDWHCARYLKHYKMDSGKALAGMIRTLRWRKEVKINELDSSLFPKEVWMYSILFFGGVDKCGHRLLYALTNRYRPSSDPTMRKIFQQFVLYLAEETDCQYPYDYELVGIVDESHASVMHVDIDMLRWFVNIRDNWPARFKSLNVIGIPMLVRPVLRLVLSWLPKEWKDMIKIGTIQELLYDVVDNEQLIWCYGGRQDGTCKLAPSSAKWSKDMFKDLEQLDSFNRAYCNQISKEEREYLMELQIEKDRKPNDA